MTAEGKLHPSLPSLDFPAMIAYWQKCIKGEIQVIVVYLLLLLFKNNTDH